MSEQKTRAARQLALLGIILQCLHVMFGVTAILGMLITQTRIRSTHNTIYHSQLNWQFVTFWMALTGYAVGFYLWIVKSAFWLVGAVFVLTLYRLSVSLHAWIKHQAINRWL